MPSTLEAAKNAALFGKRVTTIPTIGSGKTYKELIQSPLSRRRCFINHPLRHRTIPRGHNDDLMEIYAAVAHHIACAKNRRYPGMWSNLWIGDGEKFEDVFEALGQTYIELALEADSRGLNTDRQRIDDTIVHRDFVREDYAVMVPTPLRALSKHTKPVRDLLPDFPYQGPGRKTTPTYDDFAPYTASSLSPDTGSRLVSESDSSDCEFTVPNKKNNKTIHELETKIRDLKQKQKRVDSKIRCIKDRISVLFTNAEDEYKWAKKADKKFKEIRKDLFKLQSQQQSIQAVKKDKPAGRAHAQSNTLKPKVVQSTKKSQDKGKQSVKPTSSKLPQTQDLDNAIDLFSALRAIKHQHQPKLVNARTVKFDRPPFVYAYPPTQPSLKLANEVLVRNGTEQVDDKPNRVPTPHPTVVVDDEVMEKKESDKSATPSSVEVVVLDDSDSDEDVGGVLDESTSDGARLRAEGIADIQAEIEEAAASPK